MHFHKVFKIPFQNRISRTRVSLSIARLLYRLLRLVLQGDHHHICRNGIHYQVDLSEGIDLSLYLFGYFQPQVTHNKYCILPEDAVIFDIGANIGTMAFQFAKRVPLGLIYAFEPTRYAFNKLTHNLSLNPKLAGRIQPLHLFVSDEIDKCQCVTAYASWKVDGHNKKAHPIHGGIIRSSEPIPVITLDNFCEFQGIDRIDLIKVDTDGHELWVFKGAKCAMKNYQPYIIFEIGMYLLKERQVTFDDYFRFFEELGYILINIKNGQEITLDNYLDQIPRRATADILGIPPRYHKN